jgi:hypothetical protein
MTPGYYEIPVIYHRPDELQRFLVTLIKAGSQMLLRGPMTTVEYSCGILWRKLEVPARSGLDEPIGPWLENTRALVGLDHSLTSPECASTTCDLKVPMAGDVAGGVVKQ